MTNRITKLLLTSHITVSVGWLGAVAVFIGIAVACLTSATVQTGRFLYPALEVSAWYIILPFSLAALFTGIIQAVLTPWGLFRHYWIIVKLFLTIVMTALLILHLNPVSYLAGLAGNPSPARSNESLTLIDLIAKAGAAAIGLIAVTMISVYKPWGKVRGSAVDNVGSTSLWTSKKPMEYYLILALLISMLIILVVHLSGGGIGNH